MLNQPVTSNDIVTLKLITGEEVIAKFLSEEASSFTVSKPMVLMQGPKGPVLVPFILTAEKVEMIPILKTACLTNPTRSKNDVKSSYIEFTTGIKTSVGNESIPPLVV